MRFFLEKEKFHIFIYLLVNNQVMSLYLVIHKQFDNYTHQILQQEKNNASTNTFQERNLF